MLTGLKIAGLDSGERAQTALVKTSVRSLGLSFHPFNERLALVGEFIKLVESTIKCTAITAWG